MIRAVALCVIFLGNTGVKSWCQPVEDTIRELVQAARRTPDQKQHVRLLIKADAEAVKLERREHPECCDIRCVKISDDVFLHYRWNGIQLAENYEHDLLRKYVRWFRGTPAAADALVEMLRLGAYGGPWFNDDEFLPDEFAENHLHRRIISLLSAPTWKKLNDPRLSRILAEAYETWWSLSRASADDPELQQSGVAASDYQTGAEVARRKAIELYQKNLTGESDPELRSRVAKLRKREDTRQRAWFRGGD
jgi:hypothetical protein